MHAACVKLNILYPQCYIFDIYGIPPIKIYYHISYTSTAVLSHTTKNNGIPNHKLTPQQPRWRICPNTYRADTTPHAAGTRRRYIIPAFRSLTSFAVKNAVHILTPYIFSSCRILPDRARRNTPLCSPSPNVYILRNQRET